MASAERVQRLPGVVLGNDLTLEVDAVAAVSGHPRSPQKARPPVNRDPLNLSNSRGALHPEHRLCRGKPMSPYTFFILQSSVQQVDATIDVANGIDALSIRHRSPARFTGSTPVEDR